MFCKLCYTSFYCALLFCASQIVFSYNMKVCGKPVSSKSVSTIFPIAFAQFISLCQILVVLGNISNFIIIFVMATYEQ